MRVFASLIGADYLAVRPFGGRGRPHSLRVVVVPHLAMEAVANRNARVGPILQGIVLSNGESRTPSAFNDELSDTTSRLRSRKTAVLWSGGLAASS